MQTARFPFFLLLLMTLLAGCATSHPNLDADDQVMTKGLSTQRVQIISTAKHNLGVPYKWGGNTPSEGLDCSGLSVLSYRAAGYNLPRMTNDQFRQMPHVKKARPGDLMFFGSGSRATHVGIYIGNNRMIHAPGSGRGVQVAHLNLPYWKEHYLGTGSLAP